MTVFKSTTFRDFFTTQFVEERAYLQFDPEHFAKFFFEMAAPGEGKELGDMLKAPITPDKESLDFLQQFPTHLWRLAERKRWDMLHDALIELHKKREGLGLQELENKIKEASIAGWQGSADAEAKWNELDGKLKPAVLEKLRKKYTPDKVQKMMHDFRFSDEAMRGKIEGFANLEAYEEIKSQTDGISSEFDKEMTFQFKKPKEAIQAHPYLNRLYHKIERTKDQSHDPASGLQQFGMEKGNLGYDLAYPEKTNDETRTTRGAGSWPSNGQAKPISTAMKNLFLLNQHHVFGDLDVPEGAVWKPLKGPGTIEYDDFFYYKVYDKHLDNLYERYEQLQNSDNAPSNNEIDSRLKEIISQQLNPTNVEKAMKSLAREMTNKDVENGKIPDSPAIPGVNPEERKVRMENGKVKFPTVYLPFVEKNGKSVPILNTPHAYNNLGDEDWHYKYEKYVDDRGVERTRKTLTPEGEIEYDLDALKDRMTGRPDENGIKPHVRVSPEEYHKSGGKGHQSIGYHPNHNHRGRKFISASDDAYFEKYNKIFDDMEMITSDENTGVRLEIPVYKDFYDGVLSCINRDSCGGATRTIRNIIKNNIETLCNLIHMQVLETLGGSASKPSVVNGVEVDPSKVFETRDGRMSYASSETSKFAQGNFQGTGTRALRNNDPNVSRDTGGGEDGSIEDAIDFDGGSNNRTKIGRGEVKRGRGSRVFAPIDGESWLDDGHTAQARQRTIKRLESIAQEVDAEMLKQYQGKDGWEQLRTAFSDVADVVAGIKSGLMQAYTKADIGQYGNNQAQALLEKEVDDEIAGWMQDGAKTSEQLVARFAAHPLIAQATGNHPHLPPGAQHLLRQDVEKLPVTPVNIEDREKLKNWQPFQNVKSHPNRDAITQMLKARPGQFSDFIKTFAKDDNGLELDDSNAGEWNDAKNRLISLQDFINDEFRMSTPAQTTVSRPTRTPVEPAPAIAARTITPSAVEPFHKIYENKKWFDLVNHPEFGQYIKNGHANNGLNLKRKMGDWLSQGKITQAQHDAAQARIDAAMAARN